MTPGNVRVRTKDEVLAEGPLYPADQQEGPCIFCPDPGKYRLEFVGDNTGAIFCCEDHKELLLANDVYLEMPVVGGASKVRLYASGEYLGEVDAGKVE